jgi:hypothetical protein
MADPHRGFNPGDQPRRKSSNPLADIFAESNDKKPPSIADYQRKCMAFIVELNALTRKFNMAIDCPDEHPYMLLDLAGTQTLQVATVQDVGKSVVPEYYISIFDINEIRNVIGD